MPLRLLDGQVFRVAGRESRPAQPPARVALTRGLGRAVSEDAEGEVANVLVHFPRPPRAVRRPNLVGLQVSGELR